MKEFWICVSPDHSAALGLVSRVRELAGSCGARTAALAFEDYSSEELFRAGAQKIYCMQKTRNDEDIARQVALLCQEHEPEALLFPATVVMRCVASFSAALLECGLCADCTAISLREDGRMLMTRPTFADTLLADIVCEKTLLQMATVRPGIYLPKLYEGDTGCIVPPPHFSETDRAAKLLKEFVLDQNPLADARIIVSGGKGVGPAGFEKLKLLADLLGASLGASRGAVSSGYARYLQQVGLTGMIVHPDIYLAFGISGAIQHIVGMSSAKYVIAVNIDRKAPIFEHADLAIVSPWEDTVDSLIRRLSFPAGTSSRF